MYNDSRNQKVNYTYNNPLHYDQQILLNIVEKYSVFIIKNKTEPETFLCVESFSKSNYQQRYFILSKGNKNELQLIYLTFFLRFLTRFPENDSHGRKWA